MSKAKRAKFFSKKVLFGLIFRSALRFVSTLLYGDVTQDDSQRRFLVAMLEQCCNHSKQCSNNAVILCCAKNEIVVANRPV